MVGVEVLKWLWLLIDFRFLAIEFKFELGLALRFDDNIFGYDECLLDHNINTEWCLSEHKVKTRT